ncbi:MAG TPA: HEAT repeat domain-containing protein [Longimicrobiales bacterium]|nr:HEAT repeat domain-containing protein [Longimicrobiales bacterium]
MRAQIGLLAVALFVGHGGEPLVSAGARQGAAPPSGPAPAGTDTDAGAFLQAVRGSSAVVCTLAGAPVGDGWSYHGAPLAADAPETILVRWALRPILDAADVPVLAAGLRDGDRCVRSMAARVLGAAGPEGARTLVDALEDDAPVTRAAAAEGLGYAEHDVGVRPLIARLRDDDSRVRATAAWALGRMEAHEAVAPLGDALADPVLEVRLAVVEALGDLEFRGALELLLPQLADDDARIRAAAARAIGEIH